MLSGRPVGDHRGFAGVDNNSNGRIALAEQPNRYRNNAHRNRSSGGDTKRSYPSLPNRPSGVSKTGQADERALYFPQQSFPALRRHDTPSKAIEEFEADLGFQLADDTADVRLRRVQLLGCRGH